MLFEPFDLSIAVCPLAANSTYGSVADVLMALPVFPTEQILHERTATVFDGSTASHA
jgi:hypothetical protein